MYLMTNLSRHPIYCGMTSDLVRRIHEHREGLVPNAYTSQYRINRLVYFETYDDIQMASQRERNVKHYSWRWKADLIETALIETANPEWEDLWNQIAKSPF